MIRHLLILCLISLLLFSCNASSEGVISATKASNATEIGQSASTIELTSTSPPLITVFPSATRASKRVHKVTRTPLPVKATIVAVPATITQLATSTVTSTPQATPTLPHSLMIEGLQQASYEGSEITIEEILEPGDNYYRYIVSYYSEGLKIYAFMTVPYGEKPESGWPIIIVNHGFFLPSQYVTSRLYVDYVDAMARNNYIIFMPDFRGHGRSEGEGFEAYTTPDLTIDTLNGLASLQKYPDADPDRIGMWGHSMGGIITLRAMVVSPEIKAGVTWGGVVGSYQNIFEWVEWRLSEDAIDITEKGSFDFETEKADNWMQELLNTHGPIDGNPDFWEAISPTAFLDDISGPLQLHHSTTDKEVLTRLSEDLHAQLEEAGKSSELYLYDYDNHDLTGHFGIAMQRTIEFFDRHLDVKRDG